MSEATLRVIPLGGVGEIGRNSTIIEYGQDIIVIDAGLMFPRYDMPGIDIVISDYSYLVAHKERVKGIIITHGHEDHTGGLPYLLRHLNVPVYGTGLTLGLVEVKLRDHKLLSESVLHIIRPGEPFRIGCFEIEPFRVCHSIPDGVGLGIQTPAGLLVHSGDFKFDPEPVDGRVTDFAKLRELGERGILLLLSDSTNAETAGETPSEQTVRELFERLFTTATGRVIVATFASNISRIYQVIQAAEQSGRRVGIIGHNMINNVRMAIALGYLKEPSAPFLTMEEMAKRPPSRVALVCTGSQGEPTSALVRMSRGGYRQYFIQPGDTVIVSATPIPGNEEVINQTVDNLFRLGANVYYNELTNVHVSGHGGQAELMKMLELTRPHFFVPIHGEYRHLVLHARLAESIGIPKERIFVIESGQSLEVTPTNCRLGPRVADGYVFVDGSGVGDIGRFVLRERHLLSQNGFVIAAVLIDDLTNELLMGPHIVTRGFVDLQEAETLIKHSKQRVTEALAENGAGDVSITMTIKETLENYLYAHTKRRPMILPIVMKI